MARPRKAVHERRTETVKTDLTLAEKLFVQEQAMKASISVAAYARKRLLGRPVQAGPQMQNSALLMMLNRVGLVLQANLDQSPHSVSKQQQAHILQQLQSLLETL